MEKLIRVTAAALLYVLTMGGTCIDPGAADFRPSEDLSRVESAAYLESTSYPCWSPDGSELYCLVRATWDSNWLWAVPTNGDSSYVLAEGSFTAMAMAPDGESFLLVSESPRGKGVIDRFWPDAESIPWRTVYVHHRAIADVAFGWASSGIDTFYFSTLHNELFRGSLSEDSVRFVQDLPSEYFAVGPGDTVLPHLGHTFEGKPCVHPSGRYVARTPPHDDSIYFRADVVLTDLHEGVDYSLPARPWYRSAFKYFAWHPDGQKLVVSVCGLTPDPVWPTGEYELWQLANAMSYIED